MTAPTRLFLVVRRSGFTRYAFEYGDYSERDAKEDRPIRIELPPDCGLTLDEAIELYQAGALPKITEGQAA